MATEREWNVDTRLYDVALLVQRGKMKYLVDTQMSWLAHMHRSCDFDPFMIRSLKHVYIGFGWFNGFDFELE